MARSQGAKHRRKANKKAALGVAAFLAATSLTGAAVQPSEPTTQHAQVCCSSPRTVEMDYVLSALQGYMVPGTGSTMSNPPAGRPDLSFLDAGIWNQVPDLFALVDSDDYPATLEPSGPKSGTNSVNRGASKLVSEILKNDPNTTVILGSGGSQGALVWYETLKQLDEAGYPMENVFVVLYSDPAMPGTGILARYGSNELVLTTGLRGGERTLPEGANIVRVVNDGDPMAFFPRDPFNALAVINAVFGFVFEHGDLKNIDYSKATITKEGNVTTVVAHPHGDIVPLLVPLKLIGAPTQLVTLLNKLVRPVILAGGMYEEGPLLTSPSIDSMVRQLRAVIQGIGDALQYAVKLVLHQADAPQTAPKPPVPSPTQDLVHEAEDRDEELNGTPEPSESDSEDQMVTNSFVADEQQNEAVEEVLPQAEELTGGADELPQETLPSNESEVFESNEMESESDDELSDEEAVQEDLDLNDDESLQSDLEDQDEDEDDSKFTSNSIVSSNSPESSEVKDEPRAGGLNASSPNSSNVNSDDNSNSESGSNSDSNAGSEKSDS